jgi:hypothetical protein
VLCYRPVGVLAPCQSQHHNNKQQQLHEYTLKVHTTNLKRSGVVSEVAKEAEDRIGWSRTLDSTARWWQSQQRSNQSLLKTLLIMSSEHMSTVAHCPPEVTVSLVKPQTSTVLSESETARRYYNSLAASGSEPTAQLCMFQISETNPGDAACSCCSQHVQKRQGIGRGHLSGVFVLHTEHARQ